MASSDLSAQDPEVRRFSGGQVIAICNAREPQRDARYRAAEAIMSAMRRGNVDKVIDVLRILGVDVVHQH